MRFIVLYLLIAFILFLPDRSFSQKDTEFWFAAPYATPGHGNIPIGFRIFTYDAAANITISQPANPAFVPVNINMAANSAQTVDLTAFINTTMNTPANTVLNYGYKITSDTHVSAYYEIKHQNNPDIFTLKGKNALGTDFMIPHQNVYENGPYSPTPRGGFDIVATEDNTTITITPKYAMVGHPAGVPFTIVLNKGQTYSCRTINASAAQNPMGTTVVANRPIAITIHDDSIINVIGTCKDMIGDQIFPLDKTGDEYVLVRGFINGGDRIFINAPQNNTEIYVNGVYQSTIHSGDLFTYVLDDPNISAYLSTTKNVSVLQATGFGCELGMAAIPALKCTGSLEASFTRSTIEFFGLFIIAKAGSEGDFLFNDNPNIITAGDFSVVPGSGGQYLAARKELSTVVMPANSNAIIKNTSDYFHFGIINGGATSGCRFGFLSDFASFEFEINSNQPYYCEGDTILLNTNYFQEAEYYWTGPGGLVSNNHNLEISPASINNSGVYTVSGYLGNCPIIPDTLFVGVYLTPNINIVPTGPFCEDDLPVLLNASPPNGAWQGTAVSQNVFNPALALIGNNYLSYSVTQNGCTGIDSINVQVFENPQINISPIEPLCQSDNPISPVVSPPGGTWSGTGTSNNVFFPDLADIGINNLNYSVTVNGCSASESINVDVIETPSITISNLGLTCRNDDPVILQAQPAGGVWQGPGLTGNTFNPALANTGANLLTYSITVNGCSASQELQMFVIENPEINITPVGPFCKNDPPVILSATPPGGSWSGQGVMGNVFFPEQAQEGNNTLTYSLTVNGCSSSQNLDITVIENPQIIIVEIDTLCSNDSPVILEAYPAGGTWNGPGITENSFDPGQVSPGSYTITYNLSINACYASDEINISVIESPEVSLSPIEPLCQNDPPVTLQAEPAGGTWTGNSISGNMFNPALGEPGINTLNYSITVNGCTDSENINIQVTENPQISITQTGPLCKSDNPIILQAIPAGGSWTGNAVVNDIFYPQNAETGLNTLNYSVTIQGCSSSEDFVIEVIENPEITITETGPLCSNDNAVILEASPFGGTWEGTGVTGNIFNPALAETGTNTLTYSVTVNGCSSSENTNVNVIENPQINISPVGTLCKDDPPQLLEAVPQGGTWEGTAVTGNMFYPDIAQEGINTVNYSVTINGCSDSQNFDITVIENPQIIITEIDPLCSNDSPVVLEAYPSGGTWNGPGVTGNIFDPGQAVTGQNTITYNLSINSCAASEETNITVIQSPQIVITSVEPLCKNDDPVNLDAQPIGGSWTGPGVLGNMFYPETAQEGVNTINYSITLNGCYSTENLNITVIENPQIVITDLEQLCKNDDPVILEAYPAGGIWMGTGVTGNIFNPEQALTGTNVLTYSVTISNCSASEELNITVIENPEINISPVESLCKNDPPLTLSATPMGGTWSGSAAVSGNVFNPALANTGINNVNYFVTVNSCSSSQNVDITVINNPEIIISEYGPFCSNEDPVDLEALPLGGTWTGTGVTNGIFNPVMANTGINNLFYEVTVNGCSAKDSIEITVIDIPTIDIAAHGPYCQDIDQIVLQASPPGGQWTGNAVNNNIFYPSQAEAGENIITYTVTANACTNSAVTFVQVIELPQITIYPVDDLCRNDNPVTLQAFPEGGIWSGQGVSGNYFNPSTAQTGINSLTYEVTVNTCTNSAVLEINLNENPDIFISPVNAMCEYDDDITINFSPPGGVWSGFGITDIYSGLFSPSNAAPGNNTIIYFLTENGCSSTDSITISVIPTPQISITQPEPVCQNTEAFSIIVQPAGGTWSGTGISGNQFDPAIANVGNNIVFYRIWAGVCTNIDSVVVTVDRLPVVEINEINPQCDSYEPITLGPGSDFPGIWAGPGITDAVSGIFNPAFASTGQNIISFTAENGACTAQKTITIDVIETSDAKIHPVEPLCYDNLIITLKANSLGGNWSGYGVTNDGRFHVTTAGIGYHSVYYEIPGLCGDSDSIVIAVKPNDIYAEYSVKNMICYDSNDGCITFSIQGGSPPYSIFYNNSENFGAEVIYGLEEGTYSVTITDIFSCEYIVRDIPVKVLFNSGCITIPNAFTPNGDGINDTWIIENIEKYPDAEILVFNKWGQQLFAGKGSGKPWDGKYNGKLLPTGTYFYLINLYQKNTNRDQYSGTVTIVY